MKLSQNKIYIIIVHRVKELILLLRYYKFSLLRKNKKQLYISIFDERRIGFGLADRLKGCISLYALSKIRHIDYRCRFVFPFNLSSFLIPNKYNWELENGELAMRAADVKVVIAQGEDDGWKRLCRLKTKKQLHVYLNRDYLDFFNKKFNTSFEWGSLFNELFKPTPKLQQEIEKHLEDKTSYIACHLRFMSLLGDFKEYNLPPTDENQQQKLIDKCLSAIMKLKEDNNKPVFVFSDSERFLKIVASYPGIYSLPSKIIHIDCIGDEDEDTYMKPFVDFLLISKAEKIYSLYTKSMYPSEFPLYAAKINTVPFERISIEDK